VVVSLPPSLPPPPLSLSLSPSLIFSLFLHHLMVKCSNIWRNVGTFNCYRAQKTLKRQRERERKFFKSRLVTKYSKLKLYRTVIRSIVTYASETWALKETVIQKLLVFERKTLRRIFGPTKKIKYGESKPMKN